MLHKTIWVLENVTKHLEFYSKLKILSLLGSTSLWKRFYPTHELNLYCDDMTFDVLKSLNVLSVWDNVLPIPKFDGINNEIFWASNKLRVLNSFTTPVTIVDNDFFMFTNIEEHFNKQVIYAHDEKIGKFWYPPTNTRLVRNLSFKLPRIEKTACNVSFLHLPDPVFTKEYTDKSLKMMYEFTQMNDESIQGNYLVLSEQYLLKQLLLTNKIPHKSLISSKFECDKQQFIDEVSSEYIWKSKTTQPYFKHHGMFKHRLEKYKNHEYYIEIENLYKYIKAGKLIDTNELKDKIKIITLP